MNQIDEARAGVVYVKPAPCRIGHQRRPVLEWLGDLHEREVRNGDLPDAGVVERKYFDCDSMARR